MIALLTMFLLSSLPYNGICTLNSTAWYSFPTVGNVSLLNYFKYPLCGIGQSAAGYAYIIIVLVLYAIMLTSMGDYDILARIMVASFTFSIIASIMTIMGLFDIYMPVFFGLLTVISTIGLYFSTNARG